MKRTVSICGGHSLEGEPQNQAFSLAQHIGSLIADRDGIILCGGHGGIMEAACKGAHEHGGITIGILPEQDKKNANPYLSVAIPTGLGHLRNSLVTQGGDCIIVLHGSWGTLNEITSAQLQGKPIILVEGSGGITDALIRHPLPLDNTNIHIAHSAEETVDLAFSL